MPPVDVVAKLEGLAAAHPEQLNWKVPIVDLLKVLGLDSSLAARKEQASELGCPADKLGDSAQMTCGCTRPCGRSWPPTAATCRRNCSPEVQRQQPGARTSCQQPVAARV